MLARLRQSTWMLLLAVLLCPADVEAGGGSNFYTATIRNGNTVSGVSSAESLEVVTLYSDFFPDTLTGNQRTLTTVNNDHANRTSVDVSAMLPVMFSKSETTTNGERYATSKTTLSAIPTFSSGTILEQLQFVATAQATASDDRATAKANVQNTFCFNITSPVVMLLTGTIQADKTSPTWNSGFGSTSVARVQFTGGPSSYNEIIGLEGNDTDRGTMLSVSKTFVLNPGDYCLNVLAVTVTKGPTATITSNASANVSAQFISEFVEWTNPDGGTYETGSNWNSGVAPSAVSVSTPSALFNLPDAFTVDFNANRSSKEVRIAGGEVTFDLHGYTYSPTEELRIGSGVAASLQIDNGRVSVDPNGDGMVIVGGGNGVAKLAVTASSANAPGIKQQLRAQRIEVGSSGTVSIGDGIVVGDGKLVGTLFQDSELGAVIGKSIAMTGGAQANVGQLLLSGSSTSKSIATVDGQSTELTVVGNPENDVIPLLFVGAAGSGQLRITNGATVDASLVNVQVGPFESDIGIIQVSGSSPGVPSKLRATSQLTVGGIGTGTIEVSDGALLETNESTTMILGLGPKGMGLVAIGGPGSTFEASTNLGIRLGDRGEGTLSVFNGATAIIGKLDFSAEAGSKGTAIFSGVGTEVLVGKIEVGGEGEANLKVLDGATLVGGGLLDPLTFDIGNSPGPGRMIVSNATVKDVFFFRVGSHGSVDLNASTLTANGVQVTAGGIMRLNNGTVHITDQAVDVNGIVCGTGTFDFAQSNIGIGKINVGTGKVCPGTSPGTIDIIGDYQQSALGTLEIEIAGPTPDSEHDVLQVTGDVTLDGTLALKFLDGYLPSEGDSFEFIDVVGATTGEFATIEIRGVKSTWNFDVGSNVDGGLTLTSNNNAEPGGGYIIGGTQDVFESFQSEYFTEEEIVVGDADPYSDFDNDGIETLMERFLGTDPTEPESTAPLFQIQRLPSGNLEITFCQSTTYNQQAILETNNTLDLGWAEIPDTGYTRTTGTHPDNEQAELVKLEITNPDLNLSEKIFFRISFEEVPAAP